MKGCRGAMSGANKPVRAQSPSRWAPSHLAKKGPNELCQSNNIRYTMNETIPFAYPVTIAQYALDHPSPEPSV